MIHHLHSKLVKVPKSDSITRDVIHRGFNLEELKTKMSIYDDITAALDNKGTGTYAETFSFDETGDTVVGEFMGSEEDVGKYGSTVYTIEDVDGKQWSVWGNSIMTDKMDEAEVGDMVGIRYLGLYKSKTGNSYRNYAVIVQNQD